MYKGICYVSVRTAVGTLSTLTAAVQVQGLPVTQHAEVEGTRGQAG